MIWISLLISSILLILILYFPFPIANFIFNKPPPFNIPQILLGNFSFLINVLLMFIILTFIIYIFINIKYTNSSEFKDKIDEFLWILHDADIKSILKFTFYSIIIVLILSISKINEWGLIVFLNLLIYIAVFSIYKLKDVIKIEEPMILPPLSVPNIVYPEDISNKEKEERIYTWKFYKYGYEIGYGDDFEIKTVILIDLLKKFRERERIKIPPYEGWKEYPLTITPEVIDVSKKFRDISLNNKFYNLDEITNVLSMIQQSLPYSYDEDTSPTHDIEYPRYPIETLYDKTGDCECKTFLASAILTLLGYQTALLFYEDHVSLGISLDIDYPEGYINHNGYKFYYYETTNTGWSFGIIPVEYKYKKPEVVIIDKNQLNINLKNELV